MDKDNLISDKEELYRSVRNQIDNAEFFYDDSGQLIITKDAFRDREKEPSVDRAKLRDFNPSLSKLSQSDGIVNLITKNVRAIGDVKTNSDGGDLMHSVDVIYAPVYESPENLAHSQITVEPKF